MQRKLFYTFAFFISLLVCTYLLFSPTWKEKGFASAYVVASKLTDPICNAHQLYRKIFLVDVLYPECSRLEKGVKKGTLFIGALMNGFFSLFSTIPGIELRLLARSLQDPQFIYFKGDAPEKPIDAGTFSMLSWNLCCVSGGFSISDGGVLPWRHRIESLCEKLLSQNADLVCLNEIFDIQTALRIYQKLSSQYSHFYFHMGPNVVGLSSGLFVASKLAVAHPEFVAFPREQFYGRGKHCRKGFFSFDLMENNQAVVRVYATHLQHSEQPGSPVEGEYKARQQEMALILTHLHNFQDQLCVVTGDLNLEEGELNSSSWGSQFDQGTIEGSGCTWGGDAFCATLAGKQVSRPLNLDHTLVFKHKASLLRTQYIDSGFNGETFNPQALSDHKGLLSTISFMKSSK